MTVFFTIAAIALVVIWVITLVDLFRRHYTGWTIVGWLAVIVLLPFIGALIYWGVRKPTAGEVEGQVLAEAELRRSAAARPFDSTGL
jgi:membrane protease YdiL (CAAX protease family)